MGIILYSNYILIRKEKRSTGNCIALVPVFDMLNHSNEPNAIWKITGKQLLVRSTKKIDTSEEIFISYGQRKIEISYICIRNFGICFYNIESNNSESWRYLSSS